MSICLRRREFITLLGGAAAWPLAARAQQGDRVRRIGVLMPYDENDPLLNSQVSAFTQALAELGWTEGHNVRMDLRWYGDDGNRIRALDQELVGLRPDIIVTIATRPTAAVQRETPTIPNCLCERERPRRQRHRRAARPPKCERHPGSSVSKETSKYWSSNSLADTYVAWSFKGGTFRAVIGWPDGAQRPFRLNAPRL